MREQTFPYDPGVLARFPGARAYEHDGDHIVYLAERAGAPYLVIVPAGTGGSPAAAVLEFEDEHERATYLAARTEHAGSNASGAR